MVNIKDEIRSISRYQCTFKYCPILDSWAEGSAPRFFIMGGHLWICMGTSWGFDWRWIPSHLDGGNRKDLLRSWWYKGCHSKYRWKWSTIDLATYGLNTRQLALRLLLNCSIEKCSPHEICGWRIQGVFFNLKRKRWKWIEWLLQSRLGGVLGLDLGWTRLVRY